jgi:hypothetical protein
MLTVPPTAIKRGPKPVGKPTGRNWWWYLWVYDDAPRFAATWASEFRQARLKGLWSLAAAVPLALVAWLLGIAPPYALPLAMLPASFVTLITPLRERTEIDGRAVELVVLRDWYGEGQDAAVLAIAERLMRGSYRDKGMFRGKDAVEIAGRIIRRVPAAQKWAKRHRRKIAEAMTVSSKEN